MASLLLVEDHTLFRAGIRSLLERSLAGHRIVGEAADGHSAARLAADLKPDIALLDITMPTLNGIETARLILRDSPATRIIMLSMHADPAFVYAAFEAGALAYVLKEAAFGELEAAIRSASAGIRYLSPQVREAVKFSAGKPSHGPAAPTLNLLTSRERQVLQLIAEAYTSPEIAKMFGLSVRTVDTYRQRMMNKLDLHSVAALTSFAIGHGLCSDSTSS